MPIRPIMDRVFVKRLPRKEKTKSGLIIPDHRKSKRLKVLVLAVGPGKYSPKGVLIPMSVKVDDIVIIDQYAGAVVEGAEDDEIVVREDEILGVVIGDPDDVKI